MFFGAKDIFCIDCIVKSCPEISHIIFVDINFNDSRKMEMMAVAKQKWSNIYSKRSKVTQFIDCTSYTS